MASNDPDALRLTVLADHYQFYLQDLGAHGEWMRSHGADPELAPAGWTQEASQSHRIGVEPFSLAVGTARDDDVEILLRVVPAAPPAAGLSDAEHVVEASLGVPSGDLAICGPADDPCAEQHVRIAPGSYRARVTYRRRGLPGNGISGPEDGDDFLYEIDLWPAGDPAPVAVLKQGPSAWGG